jgi:hypothetical protein
MHYTVGIVPDLDNVCRYLAQIEHEIDDVERYVSYNYAISSSNLCNE